MNALRIQAAAILREHFDTEAHDSGLKSVNLEGTGASGSSSFDGAAVARAERRFSGDSADHTRVRKALGQLSLLHRDMLSLAYGCRLRNRDTEDGRRRKALRQNERNWRVKLAEIYGTEGAAVLASPKAKRLFQAHVQALVDAKPLQAEGPGPDAQQARSELVRALKQAEDGGLIAWLLDAGRQHSAIIDADAKRHLRDALDEFVTLYGIVATPQATRQRSSEPSKVRILAQRDDHGYEIG